MRKMKCSSASLSCLNDDSNSSTTTMTKSGVLRTPENSGKKLNSLRLCNTLSAKKPRRSLDKKMYRRSWGSMEEMSQEELWRACLQSVQCVKMRTSGSSDDELCEVRDFLDEYSQICEWLNLVQAQRSKCASTPTLLKLGSDLREKENVRREMNDSGLTLARTFPKLKGEFEWRIKHMNSQWDALEKILYCETGSNLSTPSPVSGGDEVRDINWVSRWVREMEAQIQPLSFKLEWSSEQIILELSHHKRLQSEIDEKSGDVHSALRGEESRKLNKKRVESLERRWIQLRLRVLEWVEHLKRTQAKLSTSNTNKSRPKIPSNIDGSEEEGGEPLSKYPRLGETESNYFKRTNERTGFSHNYLGENMGQNQDSESLYNSNSPVPHNRSSTEFSISEIRMEKRCPLSPLPPSNIEPPPPPLTNISTYYFKHSETETPPPSAPSVLIKKQPIKSLPSSPLQPIRALHSSQQPIRRELHSPQQPIRELHFSQQPMREQLSGEGLREPMREEPMRGADSDEPMGEHQSREPIRSVDYREPIRRAECREPIRGAEFGEPIRGEDFREPMRREDFGEPMRVEDLEIGDLVNQAALLVQSGVRKGRECSCELDGVLLSKSCNCERSRKRRRRVRQWLQGSSYEVGKKSNSSCDASGESGGDETGSESGLEHYKSHNSQNFALNCAQNSSLNLGQNSVNLGQNLSQNLTFDTKSSLNSLSSAPTTVVWRSKSKYNLIKERPKSFTESSTPHSNFDRFGQALSPITDATLSESALNEIESSSKIDNNSCYYGEYLNENSRGGGERRKLGRKNKRASLNLEEWGSYEEEEVPLELFISSVAQGEFDEMEGELCNIENSPPSSPLKPNFKISPSVPTDDIPSNEQDWDSYQEKYLSEPYSEEPIDQDSTLKLLAFGEDYDQILDRADSESSSVLSGFEPNYSIFKSNKEIVESDSDLEEFTHFLKQSASQLSYIERIFRKEFRGESLKLTHSDSLAQFAEMEATCSENLHSLHLIHSKIQKVESPPINPLVLGTAIEKWSFLLSQIQLASNATKNYGHIIDLKNYFDSVGEEFEKIEPYGSCDLNSLQTKIEKIGILLRELGEKKREIEGIGGESIFSNLENKGGLRKELEELYGLYEQNYQLGSYLLDKMKFLESAWSSFELERSELNKILNSSNVNFRSKTNGFSSSDSGHGTDVSSVSDSSDQEWEVKKQKLSSLRKRAKELGEFLPTPSPTLQAIHTKLNEAEREFESMTKLSNTPLNLKLIYPKKFSPRRSSLKVRAKIGSRSKSEPPVKKEGSRHWRTLRFSLSFHLALLSLFAVAWFLQPRCCENMNTLCFSLVPQLTHEKIPHM